MGLSPLHARVLWLFACVKDRWHICGLDNLYNSTKFCRVAYVHSKVLLNGVTRKGMRGLPKCVLQEEKKKRSDVLAARGTVKAAVLKNDPLLPDLVASSVYDTKPVHFLSTCCESIKWIVKERQTFNVDTGKTEDMRFLRLNQNDFYNFSMGSVDVSDQLRNSYRFDHWLRNRKWWWSLLFWWLGVMLVNAYIYYITLNLLAGKNKKELLSHHDFREYVAHAWISPTTHGRGDGFVYRTRMGKPRKRKRGKEGIEGKYRVGTTPESGDEISRTTRAAVAAIEDAITVRAINKTRPYVTDKSLRHDGSLSCRLDRSLPHYPIPAQGSRIKCGVHRWCAKLEKYRQVMDCESCRVALCLPCFKLFHDTIDLVQKKESLKKKFKKEWDVDESVTKKR